LDAPFESLPPVMQRCILSTQENVARLTSAETLLRKAALFEVFYKTLALPFGKWLVEKDINDATDFAIRWFQRDDAWEKEAAKTLFNDALKTRQEALSQQLCSAFGKALPSGFALSPTERAKAFGRASFAARSIRQTYNARVPTWAEKVKADWVKEHGSLRGLNRWTMIKRMGTYHADFQRWKDREIAVSETTVSWRDEVGYFWGKNAEGIEVECFMAPSVASDPSRDTPIVCATFAGTWVPVNEAISLAYQHPNCVHHPARSRVVSGTPPSYIEIGGVGYNLASLEDC